MTNLLIIIAFLFFVIPLIFDSNSYLSLKKWKDIFIIPALILSFWHSVLKPFKILFYIFIIIFLIANFRIVFAQASSDPAYANMQRAIGGITQQVAQSRGYSITDPRTYGTLYGMGKTATAGVAGTAAGVGVGLLIGGTAPAWATVLAFAAVTSVVSYGISLALDGVVKWAFGADPAVANPISVTGQVQPSYLGVPISPAGFGPDASASIDPTVAALMGVSMVGGYSYKQKAVLPGQPIFCSVRLMSYLCAGDALTALQLKFALGSSSSPYYPDNLDYKYAWGTYFVRGNYGWRFYIEKLKSPCGGYWNNLYLFSARTMPSGATVCSAQSDINLVEHRYTSGLQSCPIGTYFQSTSTPYTEVPSLACIPLPAFFNVGSGSAPNGFKNLTDAINDLSVNTKQQKVNYNTMALMINQLWKKAAAQPEYAGIPFIATQPVTESDVQAWAQANPDSYPTVEALTAPVTGAATSTGFFPSTTTATATQTTPATSTTPTTGTNAGQSNPAVNLGVDPNIGPPTLETTPTAQMILAPILGLFPSFQNFVVPGHSAECPKPAFDAFGKHFVMDTHCTLFEQQRSTLYSTMMLAFMLVAIFIVLSA